MANQHSENINNEIKIYGNNLGVETVFSIKYRR